MVDIHRHDEFSSFDGFGKALELAELAKKLGHTSFSTTNHGNVNGLVKHYNACKKVGIRCIMGTEAYFQPVFDKEKPRYHLCLFAKTLKGYENLNTLMYQGELHKYYNPIITFEDLGKYSEDVVCSTACIQGFISQAINKGNTSVALKAMKKFKSIFGEDFYVEIQPYVIDKEGTQERVNAELVRLADELDVKCVLTSDSHYGSKEDFPTYLKMHQIAKHTGYDVEATYKERYMPTEKEIMDRFVKMHGSHREFSNSGVTSVLNRAKEFMENMQEFEDKFEQDILDELQEELPKLDGDSFAKLLNNVQNGLKEHGKEHDKKYIARCKEELKVIKMHGFADYFLIVAGYVRFAKSKDIPVGPGRGSVCNCQVAFEIGITEVDSLKFDLDFRRFLRDDKKKLPDIDLDFATNRRQEVIDYLIETYRGHSAQVCSYGLYKVDNLVNDLAKVSGLDTTGKEIDSETKKDYQQTIKDIKAYLSANIDDTHHYNYKPDDEFVERINDRHDNMIYHFSKLYNKVRFIGTHAAGVAITGANILSYCGVRISADKDSGIKREYTVYDLADLEDVHVVKFDMLGLKTMESLGELRELTGHHGLTDDIYEDDDIWQHFADGDTDGVFQFEKSTPRKILQNVKCDCFDDMIAVSSMNRPGPLSMKMPEQYAYNKFHQDESKKNNRYYEYTSVTYGTIVYQEQLQQIATQIGKLSWKDADRLMKLMKQAIATMGDLDEVAKEREDMTERFVKGAMENGWSEEESRQTFKGMLAYVFNKGHSVSYGMISLEEMFYKIYYPTQFWYVKLRYCDQADEGKLATYRAKAVNSGALVFLPHVNYSADYSIRKVDGEMVIQEGLSSTKGIGDKAAEYIEAERKKNGPFTSYDDFYDRCKSRVVTSGVIKILQEQGAMEFSKATYIKRVTKYNSALYMRGIK